MERVGTIEGRNLERFCEKLGVECPDISKLELGDAFYEFNGKDFVEDGGKDGYHSGNGVTVKLRREDGDLIGVYWHSERDIVHYPEACKRVSGALFVAGAPYGELLKIGRGPVEQR